MPIQVHNFVVRANNGGATQRCKDREQAESLYAQFSESVAQNKEFFEVKLDDEIITIRTNTINSFGIQTYMEQTPEEIQQMQIERIRQGGMDYPYPSGQLSGGNISSGSSKLVSGW